MKRYVAFCRDETFPALLFLAMLALAGCSVQKYREDADREVYEIIESKQGQALDQARPFTIDRPSDTLRQRLLEVQAAEADAAPAAIPSVLSLRDALVIAAENSRTFQDERENLYLAALALTLQRHEFSSRFAAILSAGADQTDRDNRSMDAGGEAEMTRNLPDGGQIAASLGLTAMKIVSGRLDSEVLSTLNFQLVQPLLRGAGRKVALEGLVQAEREVIYAVRSFARFQKTFAVDIISSYYDVLEQKEIVGNEFDNYQNLITSRQRAEAMYEAGRLPEIQLGQTRQDEYRARTRWINIRQQYQGVLDRFKMTLGLPTDAKLELDPKDWVRLRAAGLQGETAPDLPAAVQIAIERRLDHLVAQGRVKDAERQVEVAKDGLKADLDLVFTGSSQSPTSRSADHVGDFRLRNGSYSAGLSLGLPLDRKSERNTFRETEINLERSCRSLEQNGDQVKLEVRDAVRQLARAKESYAIQESAVELARRRVEGANLLLEAGRAETRDLLEAQEALVEAQNALVRALVSYTVARLRLLRDTGQLEVNELALPKDMWSANE